MSAISGIFYSEQRSVRETTIEALAKASQAAGPHYRKHVSPRPGLVLQTHLLHFDRYSEAECQPWLFSPGSVLTWDGRLDNRDELLLQLQRALGPARSDASIVAAAYQRWGLDSFRRLIGDWSLALWDASSQQIVLARDYAGNRPLYCLERPGLFAWATCLDALVDAFRLWTELSEPYIAAKFLHRIPQHLTPFNGVRLLPAGHYQTASSAGSREPTRYWTFAPGTITFRRHEDCAERLRELFTEGVRVRLRTNRTIWSHLSGGWDSSTVVCLAHRLIATGVAESPGLRPVTLKWKGSRECDETAYVEAVERWCGLQTTYHEWDGYVRTQLLTRGQRRPLGYSRFDWEDSVRQAGGGVVLTGWLGDGLMQAPKFTPLIAFDELMSGHLLRFLKRCGERAKHNHLGAVSMIRRVCTYGLTRHRKYRYSKHVPGVNQELLSQAPDYSPLPAQCPPCVTSSRATRLLEMLLYEQTHNHRFLSPDVAPEVWTTHPFTHRPLVEFVLAAPPALLWDFSKPRPSMARALVDVLPPEILDRVWKADAKIPWARSRQRVLEELKTVEEDLGSACNWLIVARGYVDVGFLSWALATSQERSFLMTCVDIETWLRAMAKMHLSDAAIPVDHATARTYDVAFSNP